MISSNVFLCIYQDDSELNRKIVRRIIQSSSHQFPNAYIKEADDGMTAVDAVKAEVDRPFDFILMDYTMVLTFN